MTKDRISNTFLTGFITGLVLPAIVFLVAFLVSKDIDLKSYLQRIMDRNLVTHMMSLCVFPNVFAFLIFNRFDKLQSSRGVLGVTIIWALTVFLIKMI
ncbi:MAG TPA: hypothetical protein VMW76_07620 [Bacteroidales bacterium]|nr:hypothetical protein [Bacteroidales bacterium]